MALFSGAKRSSFSFAVGEVLCLYVRVRRNSWQDTFLEMCFTFRVMFLVAVMYKNKGNHPDMSPRVLLRGMKILEGLLKSFSFLHRIPTEKNRKNDENKFHLFD